MSEFNKRTGLVFASLFISIFVFEVFLRSISYNYKPLRIMPLKGNDWRYYHSFEDKDFVYDSYLLWRPKKNYSVFNSQGYRGKELPIDKEPGSVRIFAIGDSNTLGWHGEKGPNWPMYLDELLAKQSGRFTVINAGVWGYSSFQGLRRFKEALHYKPDMVLISFGSNDAHRVIISDAEFDGKKIRKAGLHKILVKFKTAQLFLVFLDKFLEEKTILVPRVNLQEYKDNLNEIIRLAKERKIKAVLLTRPFIGAPPNELWWKNFAPSYNAATIEVAKNNDIPVVDIYVYFKDKKEYFNDESHFNEKGHRAAANIIYGNIKTYIH